MKEKLLVYTLLIIGNFYVANSQSFSLIGNVKAISVETITPIDSTNIAFEGKLGFSVNLRIFTDGLWAFRGGLGIDNLRYKIQKDVSTDYEMKRQDLVAYLGLEKHFNFLSLNPYIGVAAPIKINTEDILGTANQSYNNGSVSAGLMLLAGVSYQALGVLRLGVEANISYNKFRAELLSNRIFDLNRLDYNTEFTVGVAF